jgi:predicted CopG family antitoxin
MKSISINDELWANLSHMKIDLGVDSLDQVIQKLYDKYVEVK